MPLLIPRLNNFLLGNKKLFKSYSVSLFADPLWNLALNELLYQDYCMKFGMISKLDRTLLNLIKFIRWKQPILVELTTVFFVQPNNSLKALLSGYCCNTNTVITITLFSRLNEKKFSRNLKLNNKNYLSNKILLFADWITIETTKYTFT